MKSDAASVRTLIRRNAAAARKRWGPLSSQLASTLRDYTQRYLIRLPSGDLTLIGGTWYITHTGLIGLAKREGCAGIHVHPVEQFCNLSRCQWAFEAKVFKTRSCKGFVGFGDANPSNTSSLVRGAEMRVAETRAVNRALRKAYGIGICSVEELGAFSGPLPPAKEMKQPVPQSEPVNGNGHHPLRDRLYLLIRQHKLDAVLVKAYASDYCDVSELRDASRDQVAGFIKHLAEYAAADREGLLCQLNSYGPKPPSEALVQITPANPVDEREKGAA